MIDNNYKSGRLSLVSKRSLTTEDFQQSSEKSPWMNAKAAAGYLQTTVGGIRNLVYRGRLVPYKPFGRLLFKRVDLDRLIERTRRDGFT